MGNVSKNEELLNRYLQAVRFLLPKNQRNDVSRELEENLRSEIEEMEAERGRPLDEEELGALLKRMGHPVVLALRYQQGRCLIGPAVFPMYWFAVKSVLGILAVLHILLPAMVFLAGGEPAGRIVGLFLRYPAVALPVFAWITIAFAVLDSKVVRSPMEAALAKWSPRSLPPLREARAERPPSVAGLVVTALLSIWWLASLHFPKLILGPAADTVTFGPIFHRLYIPMMIAAATAIFLGWIRLSRPQFTGLHRFGGMVLDALGIAILYLFARAGAWVVAGENPGASPGSENLIATINFAVGMGLTIGLVAAAVTFAWKHFVRPVCWSRGLFAGSR